MQNGESIVLASVLTQSGSTPRGTDAKMIVKKDKSIVGTIGGGSLEAYVQKEAEKVFEKKASSIVHFNLTSNDVADLGMVCGGETTVYIQYMDGSDEKSLMWFHQMLQAYKEKSKAWSILIIRQEQTHQQYILSEDTKLLNEGQTEMLESIEKYLDHDTHYIHNGEDRIFIEPLAKVSKAYVFGGGHIGYEVVALLSKVGFYSVLIDDREAFANVERFATADEVIKIDSFETLEYSTLNIDENSYIIIVTRGHLYDQNVLEEILKMDAAYIGMIGSKRKRDTIYNNLRNQGVSQERLDEVYAPIGLKIKAETPEEIAISITAEIIQVRAEKNG